MFGDYRPGGVPSAKIYAVSVRMGVEKRSDGLYSAGHLDQDLAECAFTCGGPVDLIGDDSDLEMAELMCTWMCHALAGPIGAVLNGVELLRDDAAFAGETVSLMDGSAQAASQRLRFFRAALGRPGGNPVDGAATRLLLSAFLASSRAPSAAVGVEWPEHGMSRLNPHAAQLVLGMGLVASECLPRAGTLEVRGDGQCITVAASGRGARLDERIAVALTLHRDGLGARAAPAYFVARTASRLGADMVLVRAQDHIEMTASPLSFGLVGE